MICSLTTSVRLVAFDVVMRFDRRMVWAFMLVEARRFPQQSMLPTSTPATPTESSDPTTLFKVGIDRANLLLRAGNVVVARAALEAGFRAGQAVSIGELTRTYDAHELAGLLVSPDLADITKSPELYREAIRSGSNAARSRLERPQSGRPRSKNRWPTSERATVSSLSPTSASGSSLRFGTPGAGGKYDPRHGVGGPARSGRGRS